MAARIVPVMTKALVGEPEHAEFNEILVAWDREDAPDAVGASIFQSTYRHFAQRVFEDELGPNLAQQYLDDPYYWQERLARMVTDGAPDWFDDERTPGIETRDDLFREAAHAARAELEEQFGDDPADWRWGRLHPVTFSNPLRSPAFADRCPGGGTYPERGSGETLRRSAYRMSDPYDTTFHSSMHFVADFADADKVTARIPGGVSGRCSSPHLQDQLAPWLAGEAGSWWFSDHETRRHAISKVVFEPRRLGSE